MINHYKHLSVETELLVLALKGADEPLEKKYSHACQQELLLTFKMGAMGPVRLTEVQEAQKQIINVARRLSDEGTIVF